MIVHTRAAASGGPPRKGQGGPPPATVHPPQAMHDRLNGASPGRCYPMLRLPTRVPGRTVPLGPSGIGRGPRT